MTRIHGIFGMDCNCAVRSETSSTTEIKTLAPVLERAPSWSTTALVNLKLQELSSQDFSGKYLVLLFYPCDFSFICPTELIQFSDRVGEFRALGNNKPHLYLLVNTRTAAVIFLSVCKFPFFLSFIWNFIRTSFP